MKRFVGYLIDKGIKALPRKKKVSPDIKSVKPTKDIKGSVERVKTEEFRKRYKAVDKAEDKMKTGKKMMREGQKERKKLIDTGRAVQFKHTKTVSAIKPGEKDRFKGLTTEEKPKKFKKGKELDRENKMGGGMMGRRFGMRAGTPKPKTNVEKIKETFSPKGKKLKPVDPKKQKGLSRLPRAVRNKMGYMKSGGRA
jgi:hypothetical protein